MQEDIGHEMRRRYPVEPRPWVCYRHYIRMASAEQRCPDCDRETVATLSPFVARALAGTLPAKETVRA
jgi:hypothetical protein